MLNKFKICDQPTMAGDSPTTFPSHQAANSAERIVPELEMTPEFLGLASEPFAAVVPFRGSTRLVHLSLARKVRADIPNKQCIPGRPTPIKRDCGDEIPFLPMNPAQKTSSADLEEALGFCPEFKKTFLSQIDRARAYFRSADFWRLRAGGDLNPRQDSYPASWMKEQVEIHPDGISHGPIDEIALLVAAELEGLIAYMPIEGQWSIVR